MKQLKCEMCGGTDLIKQDGVFVCQSCGIKYSVEEAKKMMVEVDGTVNVSIDNSSKIESWKQIADSAYENHSYEEAYTYYCKIVEDDLKNWFATFRKGMSKAWQSKLNNIQYNEVVGALTNATKIMTQLDYMEDVDIANAKGFMVSEIYNWLASVGQLVTNHAEEFCPQLESACNEFFLQEMVIIQVLDFLIDVIDEKTIKDCPQNSQLLNMLVEMGGVHCANVNQSFKVKTGSHWDHFWGHSVDDYSTFSASPEVLQKANLLTAKINSRKPGTSSFASINTHGISPSDMARIKAALNAGSKLEAIKIVREVTGMGLTEAKNYVEQDLNGNSPFKNTTSLKCTTCHSIYASDMTSCPTCGRSSSLNHAVTPQSANSSGGCYVATCVYSSYDCPQVWTLRRYRDDTLASSWYGRAFIRTYYAVSPTIVKWFGNTQWFKKMWKNKLDNMVSKLRDNGVEDTPYQDKDWR
ncbi:MAG: ribosomal protein L7/L12 [Clostridia bacterium]|nr:ribosomal protein L7/L12 [Clostridia bacterium]